MTERGAEISTGTAARLARCSRDTIVRWIEEGRFLARQFRPYDWWKIDRESFERYLKRHTVETGDKEKSAKSARFASAGNRF
jgi:excisionase family DNA binding protein